MFLKRLESGAECMWACLSEPEHVVTSSTSNSVLTFLKKMRDW